MPNWKKVIVSGSDASLSNLEVDYNITASFFTGAFKGDGSELTNISFDDGLPDNGYDYNIPDFNAINDHQTGSQIYILDFQNETLVGTPVGEITWIANSTGTSQLLPTNNGVYVVANDALVGIITSNGYSGSIVGIGNVMNYSASVDSRMNGFATTGSNRFIGNQIITGSLLVSGSDTITSIGKLIVTGSFLVSGSTIQTGDNTLTGNTILSGSISVLGVQTFLGNQILTGSFLVSGSTTQIGNNTLTGNTVLSGSIIVSGTMEVGGDIYPTTPQGASLGRPNFPFSALYVQSGSLYIQDDITPGSYLEISAQSGSLVLKNSLKVVSGSRTNFEVTPAGVVSIKAPALPSGTSALSISGDSGSVASINPGVLVNLTNPLPTVPMRINLNAVGDTAYSTITAKMARGTLALPTQTLEGDSIFRLSGGTYTNANQYLPGSNIRIDFIANENQTLSNRGSRIDFYTTAKGTSTNRRILSLGDNTIISSSVSISGSLGLTGSLYIKSGSYLPSSTGSALLSWDEVTGQVNQTSYKSILSASLSIGSFQTNVSQSGSAAVSQSVNFEVTDKSYGISIENGSRIKISNAGIYSMTFSAEMNCSSGADTIWMWVKKNGVNIADSNTRMKLPNNDERVMTVNLLVEGVENDYWEIAWQNLNGNGILLAQPAEGNYPLVPAVILTMVQVR